MSREAEVSITLIVAAARNGVIGNAGALPWHCKADLSFFRRTTIGHPVVMGRKTWESLPVQPLPGRFNIVVSRTPRGATASSAWCSNVVDALGLARRMARLGQAYVIGGAEIYRATHSFADRIIVTEMPFDAIGDAVFPTLDSAIWRAAQRFSLEPAQAEHPVAEPEVVIYERHQPR